MTAAKRPRRSKKDDKTRKSKKQFGGASRGPASGPPTETGTGSAGSDPARFHLPGDIWLNIILVATAAMTRLPLGGLTSMVTHDGTYYINHARYFLGQHFNPSGFPAGYPAMIAIFNLVIKDGVLAARAVSFAAGLLLPLIVYQLGKMVMRRQDAFLAALVLIITPLAMRLSMITMSESVYMMWLFLGLLMYSKGKDFVSGVTMGMAAVTRPEALGILAVLVLLRGRQIKRLIIILAGFSIVYSANVAIQSFTAGHPVLLPKSKLFGTHAQTWRKREAWIDFEGKDDYMEKIVSQEEDKNVLTDYLKTIPSEFLLLGRHVSPLILLLAVYGIYRKKSFLLATFFPFIFFPLFTLRSEPRFIYPYIPGLLIYAFLGISSLAGTGRRRLAYSLAAISVIFGIVINRGQLTSRVSAGYGWARNLGRRFAEQVEEGEKIADRKPYFAFYSGGQYAEIPVAPYNTVLDGLVTGDVKFLVCHKETIHDIRPMLKPLIYDREAVNGEYRFSQYLVVPDHLIVYRRNDTITRPSREQLVSPQAQQIIGLSWSPDGRKIAFRLNGSKEAGYICVLILQENRILTILDVEPAQDQLSWSPDSRRIAFAKMVDGNVDIHVTDLEGNFSRITRDPSMDMAPSWSPDGREIFFCSQRSGRSGVWAIEPGTGKARLVSGKGENYFPSVSPDGKKLAWIRKGEGLVIRDILSGRETVAAMQKNIFFNPSWSPDSKYLAISGSNLKRTTVYIVRSDGSRAIQVAGSDREEGNPSWDPSGKAIASLSAADGKTGIILISDLDRSIEMLDSKVVNHLFNELPPSRGH